MRNILSLLFFALISFNSFAQEIGELAPEKESIPFPKHAYGMDIMFSEGGFGLGTFIRSQVSDVTTMFLDFSISEAKDDKEFEYYDYWTNTTYTAGKVNRVYLLPLFLGTQYRLFENTISDNLRPYINLAVGPTMVVTTPYDKEFFTAFKYAHAKYAAGGYIGLGANFGTDKSNLIGLNFRYYIIHFFDQGVEGLQNRYRKELGGFYLTLNVGLMY